MNKRRTPTETRICIFSPNEIKVLGAAVTFLREQIIDKQLQGNDIVQYLNILARIESEISLTSKIHAIANTPLEAKDRE